MVESARTFLIATLVAISGFAVLLVACSAVQAAGGNGESFGGDKWRILIPLCVGLPLGDVVGIILSERKRERRVSRIGAGVSLVAALGGVYIAVAAMDLIGGTAIVLAPLITTTAGYVGFGIVRRISTRLKPS